LINGTSLSLRLIARSLQTILLRLPNIFVAFSSSKKLSHRLLAFRLALLL